MEWIKVNDRLPEKENGFGWIACLVVVGKMPVVREAIFNTKTKRFFTRQYNDLGATVNYWTPLPEPPKN